MNPPPSDEIYDYAFAGGGIAALTMARAIVDSPKLGHRILIVDHQADSADDRTLSYFNAAPLAIDALARRSFDRLTFVAPGVHLDLPLTQYRYRSLRGLAYREDCRRRLAECGTVTVLTGHVDQIVDDPAGAALLVEGRRHRARWVFDSRWQAARPALDRADALVQRFVGWEIELDQPALDPTAARLFDFAGDGPPRFHYVLPFSERVALFELVTFGAPAHESELAVYIAKMLPGVGYRVLRREGGASLLTTARFVRQLGRRHIAIGVAGGLLRASTGYALTRILKDTGALVRALEANLPPLAHVRRSPVIRAFDGVFLRLAATRGELLPRVFAALFRNNPVERVLRFLDERARFRDYVGLVFGMPKLLFLRALASWVGLRLGRVRPVQQALEPRHARVPVTTRAVPS
ncbi:MAG TPA: lycopene cyclase family protein [Polyangia bacterium]